MIKKTSVQATVCLGFQFLKNYLELLKFRYVSYTNIEHNILILYHLFTSSSKDFVRSNKVLPNCFVRKPQMNFPPNQYEVTFLPTKLKNLYCLTNKYLLSLT